LDQDSTSQEPTEDHVCASLDNTLDSNIEQLLRCEVPACHLAMTDVLWNAATPEQAVEMMHILADTRLQGTVTVLPL
jgi:hypothetical protein